MITVAAFTVTVPLVETLEPAVRLILPFTLPTPTLEAFDLTLTED